MILEFRELKLRRSDENPVYQMHVVSIDRSNEVRVSDKQLLRAYDISSRNLYFDLRGRFKLFISDDRDCDTIVFSDDFLQHRRGSK